MKKGILLYYWFVYSVKPWFERGGGNGGAEGSGTGVFAFGRDHGSVETWISFRENLL